MNSKSILAVFVVVVVVAGVGYLAKGKGKVDYSSPTNNKVQAVDMSVIPEDLEEVVANAITRQSEPNVVILDVRTDEEWETEHVKGATLWGLADHISKGEMPDIDKDTEIYVYCRSGNRAGQAIRAMQEAGFTNMTNIRGLEDWKDAGGETETGK